jgi:NTP pyrophosphatase (non-canonical NTP hydrolase)
MDIDEYRDFTTETAIYGNSVEEVLRQAQVTTGDVLAKWMKLAYPVGKLNGEAGEIAEEVFKALRDDKCELTMDRKAAIRKELGDVLYYAARIAVELDISLNDIAAENMVKLRDRKARGVLQGSGGDR